MSNTDNQSHSHFFTSQVRIRFYFYVNNTYKYLIPVHCYPLHPCMCIFPFTYLHSHISKTPILHKHVSCISPSRSESCHGEFANRCELQSRKTLALIQLVMCYTERAAVIVRTSSMQVKIKQFEGDSNFTVFRMALLELAPAPPTPQHAPFQKLLQL